VKQCRGIETELIFGFVCGEIQKIGGIIFLVEKNGLLLISSGNYLIECAGTMNAGFAKDEILLSPPVSPVNALLQLPDPFSPFSEGQSLSMVDIKFYKSLYLANSGEQLSKHRL